MTKLLVTLTTTPARMADLAPTLKSILEQSRPADRVLLYVPTSYRRFEGAHYAIPSLPAGVEVKVVPIDYGPATKVLPAAEEFRGQDVRILYCDDDQIYDPLWISRLLRKSAEHPGDCIADRGLLVEKFDARERYDRLEYKIMRRASLGIWRPLAKFDTGDNDVVGIALGFGGVLIRPEFVPPAAFEIPDVLWSVDDIWLSGQLAINGITIRQASSRRMSKNASASFKSALFDSVISGHSRNSANKACIEYFRKNHRIWLEQDILTSER